MRRSLLLFTIQLPLILIGQPIQMFTDPTATWYVADTYPNGSPQAPGFVETLSTKYNYNGDTLINGATWYALYSTEGPDQSVAPVLEGWINVANDIVLILDTADVVHTLYDLSVQVGDSVPYRLYEPDTIYLEVTLIDTLVVDGNEHRVVHFGQPPFIAMDVHDERWVEGLGSIHGPLFPARPRTFSTEVPGDSLILTCFSLADTLYWQHPGYDECETNIIQSFEEHSDDPDLTVWPNPGLDQLNINWTASQYSPVRIEVYSILGELLRSETTSISPITLTTHDLPAGCYLIRLIGKDGGTSVKWLKQ